jgi:hypothetical protein
MEGGVIVDADPSAVRDAYRARLAELRQRWSQDLVGRGGALIATSTRDPAVAVVRSILLAVSGVTGGIASLQTVTGKIEPSSPRGGA